MLQSLSLERGMWTPLAEWLSKQLGERNESAREASLRAGLDHSAISRFMSGTKPTVESCHKLAAHFGVPEKMVLELAGYFPPEDFDEFTRQVNYLASRIPPELRGPVLAFLEQAARKSPKRAGAKRAEQKEAPEESAS